MNDKKFLRACEFINKHLIDLDVKHAFNSIGSNIFFDFGKKKEIIQNGSKSSKWEWTIWIGNAPWRISKNGKFIVGSNDHRDIIQTNIQKLIGKHFHSFQFLSQFLDVAFNFDDGYQITTFFNWFEEDQWLIFIPDGNNIVINCSNYEEIKNVRKIAKHFPFIENYKELNFPHDERVLTDITYKNNEHPIFNFENIFSIDLRFCDWRLERNQDYLIGYTDLYLKNDKDKIYNIMNELIGKKLKKIDVNSFMEGRFQFEDQYVIKTFACLRLSDQWRLISKKIPSFYAKIPLAEIANGHENDPKDNEGSSG